ncbi:MAG: DUF1361 domain-containing protein [Bacteroidota bacterium]
MNNPIPQSQKGEYNNLLVLAISSCICVAFLAARLLLSGTIGMAFMVWNLFLAWVPWIISWIMTRDNSPKWLFWGLMSLWILFLPNAPYMITDLFHLLWRKGMPMWVDLCLIFSFAWTGMLLGFDSLRMVQRRLKPMLPKWLDVLFAPFLLFLVAYGVYLGRYLRFNSWDIATHPLLLAKKVISPIFYPFVHSAAIGFTLMFGALLTLTYFSFMNMDVRRA